MTDVETAILREIKATRRHLTIKQLTALTGHPKEQVEAAAGALADAGHATVIVKGSIWSYGPAQGGGTR
jgi:hypothetical protein